MTATYEPGATVTAGAEATSPPALPDLGGPAVPWEFVEPLFRGQLPNWGATTGADRELLIALGWVDARGRATCAALDLVDDLARDGVTVELSALAADGRRVGRLRGGSTRALFAVESAPRGWDDAGDTGGDPRGTVVVRVMPIGEVPIQLARWGRVGPLWAEGEPVELDRAAYERRLRGIGDEPPAGLADLWSRPWTQWSLRCRETTTELTYVLVDGVGQFSVALPDTGVVVLTPRPAGLVWGDLQQAYARIPSVRRLVVEDLDADEDW